MVTAQIKGGLAEDDSLFAPLALPMADELITLWLLLIPSQISETSFSWASPGTLQVFGARLEV